MEALFFIFMHRMKIKHLLIIILPLATARTTVHAQSQLIKNLSQGKHQTLVLYGTSLTAAEGGKAWADSITQALNDRFHGLLTTINSAKSAMWSTWGVQNLEDLVIAKKPDAVMIEFGMNDAFLPYHTSVAVARLNLNYMIDRIQLENPDCEVILQVMNIPTQGHLQQRPKIDDYYQMYRKVAKKRKLLLIDHYPHWKALLDQGLDNYLKYVPDGIHPGPQSARSIIATYILQRLDEGR